VDTTGQPCSRAVVASTVVFADGVAPNAWAALAGTSSGPLPTWVDTDAVNGSCASSSSTPTRVLVGDLAPGETRWVLVLSRPAAGSTLPVPENGDDFFSFYETFSFPDQDRWELPNLATAGPGANFTFSPGACPVSCVQLKDCAHGLTSRQGGVFEG
jgi:hypothetical protein